MSLGEDCRVLIPFYLIAVYKIVFVYRINCLLTAPSQCLHAPGAGISSCRVRPHAKSSGLGVVWHGHLPVMKQVETTGGLEQAQWPIAAAAWELGQELPVPHQRLMEP